MIEKATRFKTQIESEATVKVKAKGYAICYWTFKVGQWRYEEKPARLVDGKIVAEIPQAFLDLMDPEVFIRFIEDNPLN